MGTPRAAAWSRWEDDDCCRWGSGHRVAVMSTETTKRLTARQRARQALKRDQETAKRREEALASVLTALDDRDKIAARIGSALGDLIDTGETKTSAGELAGLTAREVTGFIRAANDNESESSEPSSDGSTGTGSGDGEVVSASSGETT